MNIIVIIIACLTIIFLLIINIILSKQVKSMDEFILQKLVEIENLKKDTELLNIFITMLTQFPVAVIKHTDNNLAVKKTFTIKREGNISTRIKELNSGKKKIVNGKLVYIYGNNLDRYIETDKLINILISPNTSKEILKKIFLESKDSKVLRNFES